MAIVKLNSDPIREFQDACNNHSKVLHHVNGLQSQLDQAQLALYESKNAVQKATKAMHEYLLSTDATQPE